MARRSRLAVVVIVTQICFALVVSAEAQESQPQLPKPILVYDRQEHYTTSGKSFIRYHFFLWNHDAYPDAIFAPSPDLPPCGTNKNASRTWIDLFDSRGKRLYGFCAIKNSAAAAKVWFALPADEIPPSWVYIEMTDRRTNTKYQSSLAETTN
jgi:hypothetical protein